VDRHGLRPRDDKVWYFHHEGSDEFEVLSLSLRGGSGSEGRGNPSCLGGRVWVCLFVFWFTVDRHGLRPRDDKVSYFHHEGSEVSGAFTFVIARRERK
jgi:hypothetical protein